MKSLLALAALLLLSLALFRPVPAAAEDMTCPGHDIITVQGLTMCVEHAVSMGAITDTGVATSLLAKLSAAQSAVDRGQPAVTARILQAFIGEVRAQSGIHIDAEHAAHMIMHAQQVIAALQ